MGQKHGHLSKSCLQTLKDLSDIQLGDIHMRLEELWSEPGSAKGCLRDKDAFIHCFELPITVGERLFAALDCDHTDSVSCEQFACGLAALLNDSVEERCGLVFHALDVRGNVTRDEVIAMATTIQRTLVAIVSADGVPAPEGSEALNQSLRKAVEDAFEQYDTSGSGSLTLPQLQTWLERTPHMFDILFPFELALEGEEEVEKVPEPIVSPSTTSHGPGSDPLSGGPTSPLVGTSLGTSTVLPRTPGSFDAGTGADMSPVTSHEVPADLDNVELSTTLPNGLDSVPGEEDVFYSMSQVPADVRKESVVLDMEGGGRGGGGAPGMQSPVVVIPEAMHAATGGVEEEPSLTPPPSGGNGWAGAVKIDMETVAALKMADAMHHPTWEGGAAKGWGSGQEAETRHPGEFMAIPMDTQGDCSVPPLSDHLPRAGLHTEGVVPSATTHPGSGGIEGDVCPVHVGLHGLTVDTEGLAAQAPPPSCTSESCLIPENSRLVPLGGEVALLDGTLGTCPPVEEVAHHEGVVVPSPPAGGVHSPIQGVLSHVQGVPSPVQDGVPSPVQEGVPSPVQEGVPSPIQEGVPSPVHEGVPSPVQGVSSYPEGEVVPSPSLDVASNHAPYPVPHNDPFPSVETTPPTPTPTTTTAGSSTEGRLPGVQDGADKVERRYSFHFQNDTSVSDVNKTHKRVRSMSQPSMLYPEHVPDRTKEAVVTAWLPDPWVQGVLTDRSSYSSQPITCPGLVAKTLEGDAVTEITKAAFPHVTRKSLLSVEHVSMDGAGLRRLVCAGCLNAALELTARVLSAHGQGFGSAGQPSVHTHKTMQMWSARISLLVHMRRYKEAEEELEAFKEMDSPDLYYQYHSHNYPDKCGSMVPFSLRMLHAQVPSYVGNHQLSLNRLCRLQKICAQLLSLVEAGQLPWLQDRLSPENQEVAKTIWSERLTRVKFGLANCLVAMQDCELAIDVYKSLAQQIPSQSADIYAGIGRLYLQVGNLVKAQEYFTLVQNAANEDQAKQALVKSNEAFVYVFLGKWREATESFQDVLDLQPDNMQARNNLSLCHVYQDNLKESISVMEQLVRSSPHASLQPALLSNLSALYDLTVNSHTKKLSLVPLLAEHAGDAFNVSALSVR